MMALVSLVSNDTCFKCMPSFYYIHCSETWHLCQWHTFWCIRPLRKTLRPKIVSLCASMCLLQITLLGGVQYIKFEILNRDMVDFLLHEMSFYMPGDLQNGAGMFSKIFSLLKTGVQMWDSWHNFGTFFSLGLQIPRTFLWRRKNNFPKGWISPHK